MEPRLGVGLPVSWWLGSSRWLGDVARLGAPWPSVGYLFL